MTVCVSTLGPKRTRAAIQSRAVLVCGWCPPSPATTLVTQENPDPSLVLYRANVTNENPSQERYFSILGAVHPTNGTGFQINRTTGVITRGPWLHWPDGQLKSPLSYEDGTSASQAVVRFERGMRSACVVT